MYVDLDYYIDNYGGNLITDEGEFKRYENIARLYINNQTANRAKQAINDEDKAEVIKMVACMLIDVEKELADTKKSAEETMTAKNVKRETVGTVSREYDTDKRSATQLVRDAERMAFYRRKTIMVDYLWQTGLLFNGVEIV